MPIPKASWSLFVPPAVPTPSFPSGSSSSAEAVHVGASMGLLGMGLLFPKRRDQKLDWANGTGVKLVRGCVALILGTQANSAIAQGELLWSPAFGSKLYLLRHQRNGPLLKAMATVYVTDALAKWEPRVSVKRVDASFENERRVLDLKIFYDIVDRSARSVLFGDIEQSLLLEMSA
jgi:phage baseplate assembly protein W